VKEHVQNFSSIYISQESFMNIIYFCKLISEIKICITRIYFRLVTGQDVVEFVKIWCIHGPLTGLKM